MCGSAGYNTFVLDDEQAVYIAVFNFDDKPKTITIDIDRAGIPCAGNGMDLWSHEPFTYNGTFTRNLAAYDAAVLEITK
jgi:hypothetical protein